MKRKTIMSLQGPMNGLLILLALGLLVYACVGCAPVMLGYAVYNYATKNVECEAIASDRARGIESTSPWKDDCNPQKVVARRNGVDVQCTRIGEDIVEMSCIPLFMREDLKRGL